MAAQDTRPAGHHSHLARILLDQIDNLTRQIDALTARIAQQVSVLPTTPAAGRSGDDDPPAGEQPSTIERLAEIPGISPTTAQAIVAEIGQDMTRFRTAAHLVSWARLSPRTTQSGTRQASGQTGKGNPYLKAILGQAAATAARTDTFLGERYRRLVKRRGKLRALVAVARSILTIIWHLLANPTTRFCDLGPDYHISRIDKEKKTRSHIQHLNALGYTVTLTPVPAA